MPLGVACSVAGTAGASGMPKWLKGEGSGHVTGGGRRDTWKQNWPSQKRLYHRLPEKRTEGLALQNEQAALIREKGSAFGLWGGSTNQGHAS